MTPCLLALATSAALVAVAAPAAADGAPATGAPPGSAFPATPLAPPGSAPVAMAPAPNPPAAVPAPAGAVPPGGYPQPQPWGAYPQGPYAYPPPWWYGMPEPPQMERRSVAALATGIAALSVGLTLVLVDTPFIGSSQENCTITTSFEGCTTSSPAPGFIAMAVIGVVSLVAGVPLTIYGAKEVPVRRATAAGAPGLPRWAGKPAGQGLRWDF